ncbi:cellulose synthase (UDP-forming) [Motilibacter peucedani]|uniref:Cellulose synthase (UDP-forming) n=2 Tax=Motilibacter peucedani TaxID=598650 RepID=A0A420XM57_9ACTN|nr:cellulose synthase (UDP-forming) [Motilibacter peucedani]
MPAPPTAAEQYSYFTKHVRWPFVWLFVAQLGIIYGYVMVMRKSPDMWLGFVLLTFMVPPVFVNLWLRVRRPRSSLRDHQTLVAAWRRDTAALPSVDVFIPVCGEDDEVLHNTFTHVRRLSYEGRLSVYVLDDADLLRTRLVAEAHGFHYVVRSNRGEWKKAGNLIHAFDNTDSEFVVVFDADFSPRADFLYETLPYMQDPRIGVVQTAQYFDARGVNDMSRYAGALQELFFRWIQPARDTYEAAIVAGTNLVYRREAVVAAGGFAQVPLGEDVHSGVKLWVANYRTRYVPLVLAKGLAPDNWEALTNQQYRWCRSSMLLMISRFFSDAPFSLKQRLCFWAAFLYYMASAALVMTSVLPTLAMIWFFPDQVHWWNYLPMVPAFVSTFVVFPRLAKGWDMRIYRVCMVNSFCHLLAVVDALRDKIAAWVPTGAARVSPKKGMSTPRKVALMARTWFAATSVLLWAGIGRAVLNGYPWTYFPAIALGLIQAYMLAPFLYSLDLPRVRDVVVTLPEQRRVIDLTHATIREPQS